MENVNEKKEQENQKKIVLKDIILRLYSRNAGRWGLAFFICLFLFLLVFCTRPVFFYLHDTNMMKTYSGYRTGIPTPEHAYGNMISGYFMYILYSLTKVIPWYSILTLLLLFVSITVICKSFLSVAYNKNLSIGWPVSLFAIVFIILFYYQLAIILYTVNAAIACCASIALLVSAIGETNKKVRRADYCLSFVLMLIGSVIRFSSYRVSVCFWLLIFIMEKIPKAFHYMKTRKSVDAADDVPRQDELDKKKKFAYLKKFGAVFSAFLLLVCARTGYEVNTQLRKDIYPQGFYELNSNRVKFMDYNTVPYEEEPEFYQSIGWSEAFYTLVKSNYFMDSKFNAESLRHIYEYSIEHNEVKNNLNDLWEQGSETGFWISMGLALTCALIAALFMLFKVFLIKKKTNDLIWRFLCGVFAFGGCLIMSVYLCWQGRFPLRAYQCIAFPALITMTLLIIQMMDGRDNFWNSEQARHIILNIGIILLLSVSVVHSLKEIYNKEEIDKYSYSNIRYDAMAQYAQLHPENVYIHDPTISNDGRLFIDSSKGNILNLILWGGTNVYTSSYNIQLDALDKKQLQTENFFDYNVYYMTNMDDEYMNMLWMYLTEEYNEVNFTQVDQLSEGVRVYKISRY